MKRLIFLFPLLFFQLLFAQTGAITGVVRDGKTEELLPGANLYLKEAAKGTTSDRDGVFRFEEIPVGQYTLQAGFLGYKDTTITVEVKSGEVTKLLIRLQPTVLMGPQILVESTRAKERETPVVFTNIDNVYIRENHTVEDIPIMLSEIPNVYAYSDAGNGTGYTYMKIRGFDQKRIGVMVNGIPLNDPEDHQVYWVDLPDFAETVQDIQVQRGVGSSLYGVSTFGGSVNVMSSAVGGGRPLEFFSNFGSYNTRKAGVRTNLALSDNKINLELRYSRLLSDGYRDRSATDQWAIFGGLSYTGKKAITQLNIYTGNEITHAAWNPSPESELKKNHRHNFDFYPNYIDNFSQPHFELHNTYYFSPKVSLKNSLFYIRGKGYYQSYKADRDLWEYGLWPDPDTAPESDLIRQKWVAKNQYGWVAQLDFDHGAGNLTAGTYLSLFNSDHWGEVEQLIDPGVVPDFKPGTRYYNYFGDKYYLTGYINELFNFSKKLALMVNLHYQYINYKFEQAAEGNFKGELRNRFKVDYNFFNPRVGANYNLSQAINIFGSISVAQREPADNELYDTWDGPDDLGVAPLFKNSQPVYKNGEVELIEWSNPRVKPEKVLDYELGFGYNLPKIRARLNLYWMDFRNEIIPFGTIDEDGNPIRGNAERTIHRGLEFALSAKLPFNLEFNGNIAKSENFYKDYKEGWDLENWELTDYSGKTIPLFPGLLANARLTYRYKPATVSLIYRGVGKQFLDNSNSPERVIPAFNLFNARVSYRIRNLFRTDFLELSVQFNNIFNEKYYTNGYFSPWENEEPYTPKIYPAGNYFTPGAEFNWIAGLRLGL